MDLLAQHRSGSSNRSGLAVLLAAIVAALTMAIVAPASASSSGQVMAWGDNESGQLGDGNTNTKDTPIAVTGLNGVTAISAGSNFSVALLSNGTVMQSGANGSDVPVAVSGLSGVTAISAGYFHSLALLSNGQVMAWGDNFEGQLGNGIIGEDGYENQYSDVPVAVCAVGSLGPCPTGPYLSEVTTVSAANSTHSLALLDDGTAVAWGHNDAGELGNGTTTTTGVPVAVSGLGHVTALAAGYDHSLALLSDGTAMAWGYNIYGQLGDGTRTGPEKCDVAQGGGGFACSTIPVAVSGLSGLIGISGGAEHSLAFRSPSPPTVTKVKPSSGSAAGGTIVTITGSNLTDVTAVKFGSVSATSFTVKSDTSITATSPPETVGTVDVTVTTPGGTNTITSADHFKFMPTVTGLSPSTGSKAGGTSVTVSGAGFALGKTATIFKFGSMKATSVNCTSTTTCTVVSPAHAVGTVDVKATVNKLSSAKNAPADQFIFS